MRRRIRKITAAAVACAVAAGTLSAGALNAQAVVTLPGPAEEPEETDFNYVTASAHRAASPLPDILGANVPSGYGMVNGGVPDSENLEDSLALLVWGSEWNTNPDPYWVNYYRSLSSTSTDASKTLMNGNAAGNPGAADTSSYVSGTFVSTTDSTDVTNWNLSVSIFTQPDALIGITPVTKDTDGTVLSTGYDSQIETINTIANAASKGVTVNWITTGAFTFTPKSTDYAPKLIEYNFTTMDDMMETMTNAAAQIDSIGKANRYGVTASSIAAEYTDYVKGIKGYIKHQFAGNYKKIAIINGVSESGGTNTYTIIGNGSTSATSVNRYVEYTSGVTDNVLNSSIGDNTSASATVTAANLRSYGVTTFIVSSDAVRSALYSDNLTGSGYEVISMDKLDTLYGITMNSVENAMGMGYLLARIYDQETGYNSSLSADNVYKYFASNFYHIKDANLDDIWEHAVDKNNLEEYEVDSIEDYEGIYSSNAVSILLSQSKGYY